MGLTKEVFMRQDLFRRRSREIKRDNDGMMNPANPMDLSILAIDKNNCRVTAVAHKATVKGGRIIMALKRSWLCNSRIKLSGGEDVRSRGARASSTNVTRSAHRKCTLGGQVPDDLDL